MKTGTSTLQATLAHNDERLAALNVRYLGWPMRKSTRIATGLDKLDPTTDVIVSDEGLWHFCGTERSDTAAIARVLERYRITIVVYLRRPDEYVEAWFSQGLKHGRGSQSIELFLGSGFVNSAPFRRQPGNGPPGLANAKFRNGIDLSIMKKLAYFRATIPDAEIIVRPFEKTQMSNGDIVADFFEAVGLGAAQASAFELPEDQNVSPSADTVLIVDVLRRRYEVPEDVLQALLRTHSPPNVRFDKKRRILRYEEAVSINEVMRPVFREVQAKWGGGATDDFFVDWDIDETAFLLSEVRDLHDREVGGNERPTNDGDR